MISASSAAGALPEITADILVSLHQHRLLSARQVHALHTPNAALRWTQRLLAGLARHGLAARASGRDGRSLWFTTAAGVAAMEAAGTLPLPRRGPVSAAQVAGPLRAHTMRVNDTGIAFVEAARARPGDECGALAWRHEVAHPFRPGRERHGSHLVIADALLSYLQASEESLLLHQRFIELDRGSVPPQELAQKLVRYSLLRRFGEAGEEPVWRSHYAVFPKVIVVLADQTPAAATRRIERVIALLYSNPRAAQRSEATVSFTTLPDLKARGHFAQIFISASQPDHYHDWLHTPTPLD